MYIFLYFSLSLQVSLRDFNPIQDGDGGKKVPYQFFPLTLQTCELSQKTFWLLVLTILSHWYKIWRPYLVLVPNYWTWTKTTPQKKCFFGSNPYKIEVMITSLIEMLELPNLKESQVKRIRNYISKYNLYLYFLIQQNLLICGEKMLMSARFKSCITWFVYLLDLL